MYTLMTVDVWDTLLRRNTHHDASKVVSAYYLSLIYADDLGSHWHDYKVIFDTRCTIEARLAEEREQQGKDGEYGIIEVLILLCHQIFQKDCDYIKVARHLADYELAFEIRHSYPAPGIVETISFYHAQQRYFLSDFYMSASDIQTLLQHHQLDVLFDGGFSSCDSGLNKRRGNIYPHLHQQFAIHPHEHLHIGDNLQSDIAVAAHYGIHTVHYCPQEEHAQRQQHTEYFENKYMLFNTISSHVKTSHPPANPAYAIGIDIAPLYIGFMLHIAEQAITKKLEKLYFFTREGEFFIQVWQQLFKDNIYQGLQLPDVEVLEVSRIATFCASLRNVSCTELMRLWNQYATQSMHALCQTLDFDSRHIVELCTQYGIDLNEDIVHPWQDPRVIALFADQTLIRIMEQHITTQRNNLDQFLSAKGFTQHTRVGIVDIGWRGTIQDNLAHLYPEMVLHGCYLGLQTYLNPQLPNTSKSAFGPNHNISPEHHDLLHAVSLLEMLSNSPNGSVTGYEISNNTISIQRLVDQQENTVYTTFTAHAQEGVLAATSVWKEYITPYVVTSQDLRHYALTIWEALVSKPDRNLLRAYTALHHNELFGVGGFVHKQPTPGFMDIITGLFSGNRRVKVIRFIRETQWPSVLWLRDDISFPRKAMLVTLCYCARGYYSLRTRKH